MATGDKFVTLDGLKTAYDALNAKTAPIRLMQYNIGKYNWGSYGGIPSALLAEKIENYKKFFCKVGADVVGIEEFVQYLDASAPSTDPPVTGNYPADDYIYNYIYPYTKTFINSQRSLKTRYPLISSSVGSVGPVSDGTTDRYAAYSMARIKYAGRSVGVLCTALPHEPLPGVMTARAGLLQLIINLLANDDYAFVLIDMNNTGNSSDVDQATEGINLITMLRSNGWDAVNGGYLTQENTYWGTDPAVEPTRFIPIDNILFKTNGKTQFVNYDVLTDDFAALSSDHIPVIADFVLR